MTFSGKILHIITSPTETYEHTLFWQSHQLNLSATKSWTLDLIRIFHQLRALHHNIINVCPGEVSR